MRTIDEIEYGVSGLSRKEMAEFSAWFLAFDAAVWDRQFEQDVTWGRLDGVADEALFDLHVGSRHPT